MGNFEHGTTYTYTASRVLLIYVYSIGSITYIRIQHREHYLYTYTAPRVLLTYVYSIDSIAHIRIQHREYLSPDTWEAHLRRLCNPSSLGLRRPRSTSLPRSSQHLALLRRARDLRSPHPSASSAPPERPLLSERSLAERSPPASIRAGRRCCRDARPPASFRAAWRDGGRWSRMGA